VDAPLSTTGTEAPGTGDTEPRRLRRGRLVLLSSACALALATGWLATTCLIARSELLAAQHTLQELRNAPLKGLSRHQPGKHADTGPDPAAAVGEAAADTARAHELTTGPLWYLAAHLPLVGTPIRTVRCTADVSNHLARDVLPPLMHTASLLAADAQRNGGLLDLVALRDAAPALDRAALSAARARAEAAALPTSWLPAANHARARLDRQLDRIAPVTAEAATAGHLLPRVLGVAGPRRYLMVFQNTAEARGTGGLPGAFAVLTADHGRLLFDSFGNDSEMAHIRPTVDLGTDYAAMYGNNEPTSTWVNSDLSPHFPYAARIWAAAWKQHSGQSVDGVIALDPSALAPLLTATGPTRLPDGTTLTGADVLALTESTSYATYQDTPQRKAFFLAVARTAATRLLGIAHDPSHLPALMGALHTALTGGHVSAWSIHPDEQRELDARAIGGALPDGTAPFAGLVVNNAAGTKLDYYLDRSLDWRAEPSTPTGRAVTVTVALTNAAPNTPLPPYVTQRVDTPPYRIRPGDNRLLVSYFATAGASLYGATLDGRNVLVQPGLERGHPTYTTDVELPARTTRTLVLKLLEPPADSLPELLRQPLVRPLHATAEIAAPAQTESMAAGRSTHVTPARP
jgi:hypothetical protein